MQYIPKMIDVQPRGSPEIRKPVWSIFLIHLQSEVIVEDILIRVSHCDDTDAIVKVSLSAKATLHKRDVPRINEHKTGSRVLDLLS